MNSISQSIAAASNRVAPATRALAAPSRTLTRDVAIVVATPDNALKTALLSCLKSIQYGNSPVEIILADAGCELDTILSRNAGVAAIVIDPAALAAGEQMSRCHCNTRTAAAGLCVLNSGGGAPTNGITTISWHHRLDPKRDETHLLNLLQLAVDNHRRQHAQLKMLSKQQQEISDLELFAYSVAHDIKSPLSQLLLFADLIANNPNATPDTTRASADHIQKIASKSCTMVDDLLRLARTGEAGLKKQRHNTEDIINDALYQLDHLITNNNIKVTKQNLSHAHCNHGAMVHLTQNLIENSIKYRKSSTPLEIRISQLNKPKYTEIIILDNGVGVEQKCHNSIFLPFKRAENRKDIAGSGIGLAVCRKIARSHGGDIILKYSRKDVGSAFAITLPHN